MKSWLLEEPSNIISLEQLKDIGVLYWKLDADNYDKEGKLKKICEERNYGHQSIVEISPQKLPNYDEMVKKFFEEHLHEYEEIRFILEGSGYFDIRGKKDEWIRILVEKGDLIVLPAGAYHRFTTDENNYTKAMRLFLAELPEPIWVPVNRSLGEKSESLDCRREYLKTISVTQ